MNKLKQLAGTLLALLSSTGFVYFGLILYALLIWVVSPRPFGWIGWILVGIFIQKNMDILRPWAVKQWQDFKNRF